MWTRMNVTLGIAALAIVAAFSGLFLQGAANKPFDVPFAKHPTGDQVLLPPDGRKDQHHIRVLKPDGVTPLRDTTFFDNGETGVTLYGDDGRLKVYRFYSGIEVNPYSGELPKTGLKSYFELAADGRTWIAEKGFYPDGNLKRLGSRSPDGSYLVEGYFGDGVRVAQKQTFGAQGALTGEETFWENGQRKTLLAIDRVVFKEFSSWYADGKKSGYIKTEGTLESGEFYYEDGKTLSMRFKRDVDWVYMAGYSVVFTEYFNREGTPVQTRLFKLKEMAAIIYAAGGNSAFSQGWTVIDEKRTKNQLAPDNYRLKSVKVDHLFGLNNVVLDMSEDGKTVTRLNFIVKLKDGKEERHGIALLADGTATKEYVSVGTSSHELEGKGRRFVVPEIYLRQHAYDPPPSIPLPTQYPHFGY